MTAIVLDTHVAIWLVQGDTQLSAGAVQFIETAARERPAAIAAISIWEIGMLAAKGRLQLGKDVQEWVEDLLALPGLRLAPLEPSTAVASSRLPGVMHGDPADRILAATARHLDATLVTADEKLLAYGAAGYLKVRDARAD